jgi:hypothetical protein
MPDDGPSMSVEAAAWLLRAEHPDKPLILVVCNPAGEVIHVPGVYYSKQLVWSTPNWLPGGDGRIEQFTRSFPTTQEILK